MMIKSKKLFLICFISVVIANNPLRVNHNRLNNNFIKLSKISSIEFGSLSRVAYTDADINGRKYVMELMISAGMDVKIDEGGNIIVEGGVLSGKGYESGCYVKPAIVAAESNFEIVQEETFAPILYLLKYSGDVTNAIQIQNNVIHQSYVHGVKELVYLGSTCAYPKQTPQPMKEENLLTGSLEPTN